MPAAPEPSALPAPPRKSAPDRPRRRSLFATLGALAGAAAAFFALFWAIDLLAQGQAGAAGFNLFFQFDTETLQNTLGSLAQIIVSVLGIAITVVSIVVQLAATRYSSHIASMFFRDRTNLAVMGFFVVACIDVVWVSLGVHRDYVPRLSVAVSLFVLSGSLLLLIPYFAYVFDFLDPTRVIAHIGDGALQAAGRGLSGGNVSARQAVAAESLERLADVAVNSVAQKDKVIAAQAVATLRDVGIHYLERKDTLPVAWFALGDRLREDADFVAMARPSQERIAEDRVWLEWKVLRQLRAIFAEALEHLPDLAHNVAIATRHVGRQAVLSGDRAAVATTLKFFNTYLRTAFNRRDVRTAYGVLNEYRQLAEDVMVHEHFDLVLEIAGYFKYYGQTAHGMGLGFVTETAAYDLSVLCERAFAQRARCHAPLLRTFLEVDKEAETSAEEKALRGVRKAQVRLATYYLVNGAEALARTIFEDMEDEAPERLGSIRAELEAVSKSDFWEITDRGINFDYLDAQRKEKLEAFFGWFRSAPKRRPPSTIPPLPATRDS